MALHALSLALLLFVAVVAVRAYGSSSWLENGVAVLVLAFAQILLITNALSLLGRLEPLPFLLGQALLCLPACWVARGLDWRVRLPALAAPLRDRWVLALCLLLLGLLGLDLFLALYVPPNTVDSMTYHLARIGFWLQNRSLAPYPTSDPRQVEFPFNAEILIAHSVLFLRSDRCVALVQLLSYFGAAALAYLTARRFGAERREALCAALVLVSLPAVALQATSTQNDLTAAFFMFAALYFSLRAIESADDFPLLVAALAAAGGVGTKAYTLALLPVLGVHLVRGLRGRRRLRGVGLFLAAGLLLGSYSHLQNLRNHGSPFGDGRLVSVVRSELGLAALKDNLAKVAFDALDLYPFYSELTRELPVMRQLAALRERAIEGALRLLDVDPAPGFFRYRVLPRYAADEDTSGLGVLGLAVLLPAWVAGLLSRGSHERAHAVAVLVCFGAVVFALAWQPFFWRFLLLPAVLCAPLAGRLARRAWTRATIAGLALLSLAVSGALNEQKPLLSIRGVASIFGLTREQMRYLGDERMRAFGRSHSLAALAPDDKAIGLRLKQGSYPVYALFGERFQNRLRYVGADANVSEFDYVLVQHVRDRASPTPDRDAIEFIAKNGLVETSMPGLYAVPKRPAQRGPSGP